jgi:hypothetical protein
MQVTVGSGRGVNLGRAGHPRNDPAQEGTSIRSDDPPANYEPNGDAVAGLYSRNSPQGMKPIQA